MRPQLRYGTAAVLQFELEPAALLAECQAPRGAPLADVAAAISRALAAPLAYPPLASAVVPGDRVVIALEPGVPQADLVVAGVVEALAEAGVVPGDITVLSSLEAGCEPSDEPEAVSSATAVSTATRSSAVRHLSHDPANRGQLSYLTNIGEGKPVYLNRAICEADFVVPIGCLRPETPINYQGVWDGVFPTFADAATLARYRSPAAAASQVQRKRLRKQAHEVGWLLGALFTVRVLPGPAGTVLDVLAGDVTAVEKRGAELLATAWDFPVPARASLVVAAIEGGPKQQTWFNVARALSAAAQVVATDGTIAVCSELEIPPGPALQHLSTADSAEEALRAIVHERWSDALVASQLLHALENGRVYLLSRLEPEIVESLGIAPVEEAADLERLAARHDSCILVANAQYASLSAGE